MTSTCDSKIKFSKASNELEQILELAEPMKELQSPNGVEKKREPYRMATTDNDDENSCRKEVTN